MNNFELRDYQKLAHEQIEEKLRQGLKTLLVMATGAGKSKTIVSFIKKWEKQFCFVLVVKNRKLVNQLAEDTKLFGLSYGVYMADHDLLDTSKNIQVCSIDTIHTRGQHPHINNKKPLMLIIDEADQAKSSTFQSMMNRYLNREGHTSLLGMTATPYNGLDFFDCFINPITPLELRERGFLVDYRYYIPKESLDYKGIELKRGEWVGSQVAAKMNTDKMIRDNFAAWLRFGENRQTLVFCSDKKHAMAMTEYINNYYGQTMAAFVYDKTSDFDRRVIFNEFENGRIRFLINIRIITRGVDIPIIGCILDLAATVNLNLHIQKLGRGSRKNTAYDDCIVIDPVKNVINNGHFYQKHEIDLSTPYKKNKAALEVVSMRVCDSCFRAAEPQDFGAKNICTYCGFNNKAQPKKKISKAKQEKIFLEQASEEQIEQRKMIKEFKSLYWKIKNIENTKLRPAQVDAKAQERLVRKYGIEKVLKVRKSIRMTNETMEKLERRYAYKPLGGL